MMVMHTHKFIVVRCRCRCDTAAIWKLFVTHTVHPKNDYFHQPEKKMDVIFFMLQHKRYVLLMFRHSKE